MEKLLYIDACIRDELSRTKKIANPIINKLKEKFDVTTLVLNELNLQIVLKDEITRRNNKIIPQEVLNWANLIKNADRIVISAPFWDMSIPAALKNFLELCSIFDVTFSSNEKICYGLCKASNLLFITTRGMNIKTGDSLEQATPYIKALSWLWGIKNVEVLAAENFDYLPEDVINKQIEIKIQEGLKLIESF